MIRRLTLTTLSLLAVLAMFAVAGCGSKEAEQTDAPPTADSQGRMPTSTQGGATSTPVAPATD